ncbi:RNA methyltransferase [soil metagenome]
MTAPLPPVVILDRPQMAENIGAVGRVMANFGLDQLRLVRPRAGWDAVFATTACRLETRQPVLTPRGASRVLYDDRASGLNIGLLFGAERAGLETTDIALCHGIVTIPIDPRHQSLNLAQAVAINAYEWRTLVLDAPPPNFREGDPPADGALALGMYEHLEKELDAAGFFHPPEKFRSMSQNLRVMLGRAAFSAQEVATFRGVITALSKGRGRVLERLAREKAAKD